MPRPLARAWALLALPLLGAHVNAQASRRVSAPRSASDTVALLDGRRIPPLPRLLTVREQFDLRVRWLEERHRRLLPMMRAHGVGMWIVMNEEFHNDPLTEHVAPPLTYVSRRDAHVFVDGGEAGLLRYSNYWRPTATYARFFQPLPAPRSDRGTSDLTIGLRELVARAQPKSIALAIGGTRGQDSGLSRDSYELIVQAIGAEFAKRIIPAAPLIEEYLDTRLPEELEHYRTLVTATDILAQRVLSNEVITPGRTTAADIAWWWNDQVARLGVGAGQWFEVHTAVQRFDAATGKMIPYVHPAPDSLVFQPGDVIHLDCGFTYLGFASDWQKVAYVLRPGETDVPAGLKRALANGNRTQEALRTTARPGMSGYEAAQATIAALAGVEFAPSIYSHPIGTHGHGVGPQINARGAILAGPPPWDSKLRLGSYRSIELSATTRIPEWNNGALIIPFEDDAVLTATGYEWFRPPQTRWYLIHTSRGPSRGQSP
ncbi:MAG: M24 family metallopeptidase [Gemmatimonadaceae bacterium]|nr:M24 family metallopeptidase [Gemmatimonadaceae bacterium]